MTQTPMTISQIAQQAGVRPSTLRYYESIGLLPAPQRHSGRRRYDPAVLDRLAIIRTAQQAGFTLAELRVLFEDILTGDAPTSEWHALVERKLHDIDALLRSVQTMKHLLEDIMGCEDSRLAECLLAIGQGDMAGPSSGI